MSIEKIKCFTASVSESKFIHFADPQIRTSSKNQEWLHVKL